MFVPKYYEMDPATEDLLFDGRYLQDGMVILMGEPSVRAEILEQMEDEEIEIAKRFNRWMSISHVTWFGNSVAFLAHFPDGTKKKIVTGVHMPWLVKIDSLPLPSSVPPVQREGFDAFGNPPRHSDNGPETTVFRFRNGEHDRPLDGPGQVGWENGTETRQD